MGLNFSEDLFFCSSPNFGQKMGLNFSEDLFFWSSHYFGQNSGLNFSEYLFFLVIFGRHLGTRHRPSYPLEKFLSEALHLCLAFASKIAEDRFWFHRSFLILDIFFGLCCFYESNYR